MVSLAEIAKALDCKFYGNGDLLFTSPSEPETAEEGQIALAIDKRYIEQLDKTKAKAAIIGKDIDWNARGLEGVIIAKNSKLVLAKVTQLFNTPPEKNRIIDENAIISQNAVIGKNPSIGSFVTIAKNVTIGDNVTIENFVSIESNVIIGNDCYIRSGTRLGNNTRLGDRLICHQNVVIGSDGFSFTTKNGESIFERLNTKRSDELEINKTGFKRVASVGGVIIGDDVEIGANSCIDKGTLKNTIIGGGTKLDNLVHIAHNVKLGINCLVAGQTGIAGSTNIGNNVTIAGQCGIADNIQIGDNSIIAAKSAVLQTLPKNSFVSGNPARQHKSRIKQEIVIQKLPDMLKRIRNLENILNETKR